MKPLDAIRCTHTACTCECFAPGKQSLRHCETCNHGWVSHALDKLGTNHLMNLGLQVEVVQPNIVFDIASLMLYGAHATPVRLKILLDRLFSVLQHEEVLQVLHGFGWTYEDYARGYILQDSGGRVLDKWCVATREEEMVVLQQFLRFGETKAIAQEIILQDTKDRHEILVKQSSRAESDIKKFIERSNMSMQNYIKSYESTRQLFGSRSIPFIPPGPRLMSSPIISPNYSPTREPRAISVTQTQATSTTPLTTPPLNRLQTMQPFDARKEQLSPAVNTTQAINLSAVALDKTPTLPRAAVCESPKNLSFTSTPAAASAAESPAQQPLRQPSLIQEQQQQHQQQQQHHQQQQQQQPPLAPHQQQPLTPQQGADEVDGVYYNSESDEEGEVLDYSNKDNPDSPSDPDKKNKQHMRKSTNPIKRQWTPSANFGSTLIGPNGKKRVLCTACNKTFCDKGALKIHYSAVHLKEMHKCSVDGCNMMFSSRRSRNRHSANPNPKLHMPQKRKEELEEAEKREMATKNGHGVVSIVSAPNLNEMAPQTMSATTTSNMPILDTPRVLRPNPNFLIEMSTQFPFLPPPDKRIKLEMSEQPTDLSKIASNSNSNSSSASNSCDDRPNDEVPCDLSNKKFDIGENNLEIDLEAPIDDSVEKKEETKVEEDTSKNVIGNKSVNRRKSNAPTRCAQGEEHAPTSDDNSDDKDPKRKPSGGASDLSSNSCVQSGCESDENKGGSTMGTADGNQRNNSDERRDPPDNTETEGHCFQNGGEKTWLESKEAKNFPKIASLLCANGTNQESEVGDEEEIEHVDLVDDDGDADNESERDDELESVQSNDSCSDCPPEYSEKDNPMKCSACGKVFQNSFTVKIHYQNVHLKVMHSCTVEGCNSSFPSKRSRDRHSSNLNLHRRLLAVDANADTEMDDAMKGNILAKLYGHDLLVNNVVSENKEIANEKAKMEADNVCNNNVKLDEREIRVFSTPNNVCSPNGMDSGLKMTIHSVNGRVSKAGSAGSEALSEDSEGDDVGEEEKSDFLENNMFKAICSICNQVFSNALILQEHISMAHPNEQEAGLEDNDNRRLVSPRRNRSRHKSRNGITTRKASSL